MKDYWQFHIEFLFLLDKSEKQHKIGYKRVNAEIIANLWKK